MTPPMTELSQPKDMAPKQACNILLATEIGCEEQGTYRGGEEKDSPAVDLVWVRFHRVIVDDFLKQPLHTHGCDCVFVSLFLRNGMS